VNTVIIFTASTISQSQASSSNARTKSIKAYDYRHFLRRRTKDGALPETTKKSAAAQWVVRLINTYPLNLFIGEGGLIYFINLLREGRKAIKTEGITHLYSSYRPFADHYAAYWLKKKYPHVYWIADFRDLMIDPHYGHILFPETHQPFFKKIFGTADLLTTVSDGLATQLAAYNPKVITLRNGIEGEIKQCRPLASPFFTIAYTGSMFLDKRNAAPLFQALQGLFQDAKLDGRDIRIIYAGKDSLYWKKLAEEYRFESILEDRGVVTTSEASLIQQEACINILLTISSDQLQGVLTGKMIEYFESGSPVLGIIVGQNDPELQAMLHELEIGDCFADGEEDVEAIKAFILHEYRLWKSTGMNRKPVNIEILKQKYSMESVMKPFMERLSHLPPNPPLN
jgi:hypothetical protein